MSRPTACLLVVLLCCETNHSYGQLLNLRLDHCNTEDGLSQNLVYSMVQDRQGFIWFGTDEGLNRYDGYEFKVFKHAANDSTTLTDNSIHALLVDKTGKLWIGTNNGVSVYDPKMETIKNLPVDYMDFTKLSGTGVNTLREDGKGNIWIAYLGSGVDVITPGKREVLHYTIHRKDDDPYRLPNDYVTAVEFLKNGETILGSRSGLIFLKSNGTLMPHKETSAKYPWKDKIDPSVKCIRSSADGKRLWIGTESNGIASVNLETGDLKTYNTTNGLLFNNNVPALYEDSKHQVWIGGEAIYMLDEKNDRLIPYNEFGVRGHIENKNPILSIFEDRDRNVWFGTFRLGALKYNPKGSHIMHYNSGQGAGSITNNQILSFAESDDKMVWVGTDGGGLFRLSKDQSTFEPAPLSSRFSSQVIKCIYKDKVGTFWMGTWDGGMMRYNPELSSLEVFRPERKNFDSRHVWDIQSDNQGGLWIATLRDGLSHYNPLSKKFTYFKSNPPDSSSLVNNDVLAIFMDSENTLWVGTSDGLSVLHQGQEKFINRQKKDGITNALCFYEDTQQRIWIGTNGGGIIILDRNLNILKNLTEEDGLPSPTVCSILSDKKNNLWVSTYNGLIIINPADFTMKEISQSQGLQGKEFIARSGLKLSNGQLLFGGVNGFNVLNPDSLTFTPTVSNIIFTSLKIRNEEIHPATRNSDARILDQSITLAKEINLNYDDNSITLSFSPLLYNWQNNVYYTYKLENFDPEWQFTPADRRIIHYTSLDPGNYVLKVKGSLDGKFWPAEATTLTITVVPPWWATLPFRLMIGLVGVGLLYGLYKGRVRLLKKREQNLEKLVTERTTELRRSNLEIQTLLQAVAEQKNQIEEKNHELMQVNDSVVHQRDDLEIKSAELEKTQGRLKEINSNLEVLVEKRTQKLSNTLRELETFLYRASHDLRGPISSMLGILNISEIDRDNEQLKKTYSELFHKTVLQLDRTLQKLLLKHTIERKKLVNEYFAKADFEIFLWEISSEISSFRKENFVVQIDDSVNLLIDRLMLSTILISLLENAFFYNTKSIDQTVTLDIKQVKSECIISVSDKGPGVRPDLQEKIFQMFYRGHEFSTGNGLGLYMVKSVLDKINGRIVLESIEGEFAIFRVYIPQ
jgi:ligand-binding sensor domain-containing protein/signal transduction histidine kinase